MRRAFDVLKIDGVLCADHSPLAYFKIAKKIAPESIRELHQQFWNHGGAPLLVLVIDDAVQVYSGMTRPVPAGTAQAGLPSLVTTLDRVARVLQEFLISVESGEFFRQHQRSFNPAHRVDRDLLDNLRDTREKLDKATREHIPATILDALLCRLVFTCYLFDRGVIGEDYLAGLGVRNATHLRDVLGIQPRNKAKKLLYRLFNKLGEDFNGDLFSDGDLAAEQESVHDQHIKVLDDFFQGTAASTGQRSFWPYDFGCIPIETISAIYERFLKASAVKTGAFYTPRFLAEVVLDTALENTDTLLGKRFLDPACGSGIFLVGLFNRIAEEWRLANPTARNDRKSKELMRLLQDSLKCRLSLRERAFFRGAKESVAFRSAKGRPFAERKATLSILDLVQRVISGAAWRDCPGTAKKIRLVSGSNNDVFAAWPFRSSSPLRTYRRPSV